MRTREVMKVCLVLCCTATMVLGQSYYWTGNGVDDDWSNNENWDCRGTCFCFQGDCGYPDDTGDDAWIPSTAGPFQVDLITEVIDDMTIDNDVDFGSETGSPVTLTVDSLTICGDSVVTITGATIKN